MTAATTAKDLLNAAGYERRKSLYAGTCCCCGAQLDAGKGRIVRRTEVSQWRLLCRTTECTTDYLDMQCTGNPATVPSIAPSPVARPPRRDVGQWDGVAEETHDG